MELDKKLEEVLKKKSRMEETQFIRLPHDQSPVRVCSRCGSLVFKGSRAAHREWHEIWEGPYKP
jgi:hypothetical protein